MEMEILPRNMEIFRSIFNWHEVSEISKETLHQLVVALGLNLNPDQIKFNTSWAKFKKYEIMALDGQKLFFLKRLWEHGSLKEIIGLELGRLFDPELTIDHYVFGTYKEGLFHQVNPFVMTSWIPGIPFEKKNALHFAYYLGRQYELGRWLCLYDCHPRHYFVQSNGSIRRIDFGLAMSKLNKRYEGFADIWPKELLDDTEFHRGIKYENQMIHMRFEVIEQDIWKLINHTAQLQIDDFIDFEGARFKNQLLQYWKLENIIDEKNRLVSRYNFLHSPIIHSSEKL